MEFFKCLTQLDGCRLTTDWLGPCRDFFMLQSGKGVCFKIWRKNYYQKEFRTDARQPLPQIRLSVSMSLGAGQIIFLARINATENKVTGLSFYSWNEFSLHREYLVERSTIRIRKLVLSTGCPCYNSGSNAVFLDGRFLLDADRGNLSLPLRCESL
ncbi:uncharacterized protein [Pocillopora verrucosa]|uniref:uncharacterized protein isoform X1 n=1 Tax=Pocillopora verrucosa TaxID=203993 RepID=UPI003342BE05